MKLRSPKHEPALALGALLDALLDEGAVGRDAGAGADHDDRPAAVLGQAEVAVRLDVDAHRIADAAPVGEVASRRRPRACGRATPSARRRPGGAPRPDAPWGSKRPSKAAREAAAEGRIAVRARASRDSVSKRSMSCRSAANSAKALRIRKLGDIAAAGELGVGLDQRARQCRHVEALAQLLHHAPVGAEPNRLGELQRECRIVLRQHADGVARR